MSASEKMRMLKDIMAGQNLSEKVNSTFRIMAGKIWIIALTSSFKDFLDLMKTQFGDKTREEMEAMLKSGMSMEQVGAGVKCSLSHIEEEIEQKQSNGCRDVLAMSKLREKTYHTSSPVMSFVF